MIFSTLEVGGEGGGRRGKRKEGQGGGREIDLTIQFLGKKLKEKAERIILGHILICTIFLQGWDTAQWYNIYLTCTRP